MPSLDSILREKTRHWPDVYMNREKQLGATASLINFGDIPNAGKPDASTFTGMKFSATGLSPVWTPSSALSAWATAFDLTNPANWQGDAPVLRFDGTNDYITSPDDTWWPTGNGTADEAFSLGMWVNFVAIGTTEQELFSKADWGAPETEWQAFLQNTNNKIRLLLRDQSVPAYISRYYDTAPVVNRWYFLVFTYDATEAATGIKIYLDGVQVDDATTNDGVYTAMEDKASKVFLGARQLNTTSFALPTNCKMLGGPFCPFLCLATLTAAQVANMYNFERLLIGV